MTCGNGAGAFSVLVGESVLHGEELGVERATSGQMEVTPLEGQLVNGSLVLSVTPPAGTGQEDLVFHCPDAPTIRGTRMTFSWG